MMSKPVLMILAAVVVIGGIAAGVYYMKGGPSSEDGAGGVLENKDINGELTGAGEEQGTGGTGETGTPTEPKSNVKITEEMCIEITAHVNVGMQFLVQQNTAKMMAMEQKVQELEKQYNVITRSDEFGEACNGMINDYYIDKLNKRTMELMASVQ